MNKVIKAISSTLLFGLAFGTSVTTHANGVSPYLPLKSDPLLERELDRLASVAQMPLLTKPYHAKTVVKYLEVVKESHPELYRRIDNYLKRFKKQGGITHYSITAGYGDEAGIPLDNSRGLELDDNYNTSLHAFYQFNEHVIGNVGGHISENGQSLGNTYLSMGWDVFQVDVGYRETWMSPHIDSALLRSTQAEPNINLTISNSALLTSWNVKYEFSVGLLSETDKILYQDELTTGKPGYMTMHLSLQPFDWWTIGFNRSYMFGGGGRSVDLGDIWKAIIDPVNSDNCGGSGTDLQDCDDEVGNQIASISNRVNFSVFDTPVTLNWEYAGEDTKEWNNYELGNLAQNFGVFLPYLGDKSSLNLEYAKFHQRWYVHHIYGDGYSNEGNVMGHWWGDFKDSEDSSPGKSYSANFSYEYSESTVLTVKMKKARVDKVETGEQETGHQIDVGLATLFGKHFVTLDLTAGKSKQEENFYGLRLGLRW